MGITSDFLGVKEQFHILILVVTRLRQNSLNHKPKRTDFTVFKLKNKFRKAEKKKKKEKKVSPGWSTANFRAKRELEVTRGHSTHYCIFHWR